MKSRLLDILLVIALIVSVDAVSRFTGLPFTVGDVLLLPLLLVAVLFSVQSLLARKKKKPEADEPELTLMKLFGSLVGVFLALLLGLWSLYEGVRNPFLLYTGVKGAVHGYTLLGPVNTN